MINGITQGNLSARTSSKSTAEAGNLFADILSDAIGGKSNELLTEAPDKWLTEYSDKTAIEEVTAFLNEKGIDARKREPTHSLTDEQKDWLRSRHDFDAIGQGSSPLADDNFRADLVLLGVITPDEANGVRSIAIPTNVRGIKWVTPSTKGVGLLETLRINLSVQKNILGQVEARYDDPLTRDANDLNFIESVREHISFQEMYIEMMKDLLG